MAKRANAGVKSSQAGTTLRSIFTRLATDAGTSSQKLGALGVLTKQLGVEFFNTDGSARVLNDVLMESREAWQYLTAEQQVYEARVSRHSELYTEQEQIPVELEAAAKVEDMTTRIGELTAEVDNSSRRLSRAGRGTLTP